MKTDSDTPKEAAGAGSSPSSCSEVFGSLWLDVEVSPGSHINDACRDAVGLANKLGLTVWFEFNGVRCGARPGDDWELLVANAHDEMASRKQHKVACANPRNVTTEARP